MLAASEACRIVKYLNSPSKATLTWERVSTPDDLCARDEIDTCDSKLSPTLPSEALNAKVAVTMTDSVTAAYGRLLAATWLSSARVQVGSRCSSFE